MSTTAEKVDWRSWGMVVGTGGDSLFTWQRQEAETTADTVLIPPSKIHPKWHILISLQNIALPAEEKAFKL